MQAQIQKQYHNQSQLSNQHYSNHSQIEDQQITKQKQQIKIQQGKQNELQSNKKNIQSQIQPSVAIEEPNKYAQYRQSLNSNWNMNNFNINQALQQFSQLDKIQQLIDSDDQQINHNQNKKKQYLSKQIYLKVYQTSTEPTSLITKKTVYFLRGRDKNGQFQITRLFKEFVKLREKLVQRWPGCFIPPIITKKLGNNPFDLMVIRMKFLNNFLKKIARVPQIYYSLECQLFFKHDTQQWKNSNGKIIEENLQLKPHSNAQLLQKYIQCFSNSIQDLTQQQQNAAMSQIRQLQSQLKSWKADITRYKDQVRSLISAKDKYYQAMTKLNTFLLPQYEQIVLDFVNNGINLNEKKIENLEKKQGENKQYEGYLLNTAQYGSALKDTALSVQNYNQSLWIIYDIFKFELKQTDSILQSIQSYEYLVKERQYLIRNITNNKQQLQSLGQKKTTLKLFLMSGSIDQKKEKLAKQSQELQQKLKIVKELLNYVLNLLINSIQQFHTDRSQSYKRMLAKSSQQQIVIVKKLMDFHMFQLQIFNRKNIGSIRKNQTQQN